MRAVGTLVVALALFALGGGSARAEVGSWPQLGADAAHTGASSDTTFPATTVNSLHALFVFQSPHAMPVPPAVAPDAAYAVFGGGIQVLGLDGRPSAAYSTGATIQAQPALDEGRGVLWVLDAGGNLSGFRAPCAVSDCRVARAHVGECPTVCSAAPVVGHGMVVAHTSDGRLVAYRLSCRGTCAALWHGDTGPGVTSTPALAGDLAYVGTAGGAIAAYRLTCSTAGAACLPAWRAPSGDVRASTVAVDAGPGIAFWLSADGSLYGAYGCPMAGIDATCAPRIVVPLHAGALRSRPVVDAADGLVFVALPDGTVDAFRIARCAIAAGTCTPSPVWTGHISGYGLMTGDDSPALADGVLWIGDSTGFVHAFTAAGCGAATCPDLLTVPLQWVDADGAMQTEIAAGRIWLDAQDASLPAAELIALTPDGG